MKQIITGAALLLVTAFAQAQNAKGITLEEYQKAKTFAIKDLDNDTYAKFDNNKYVLDRYEARKPYFITGDDSLKKRIDLYSLLNKADQKQLGTVIYYTNEKAKQYTVCLPNAFADKKVWDTYFEDIHAIDKEEKNFVLKLSYVLSKEYSYQSYKSSLKGKEIDRSEAATYGTDICFPGDELITLSNGQQKAISDIQPGDEIITAEGNVKVKSLISHEAKNYAITSLVLSNNQRISATPNHPIKTKDGIKKIGEVKIGDEVSALNGFFKVIEKTEQAPGKQQVYNIEAAGGTTLVVNGVVVMQK